MPDTFCLGFLCTSTSLGGLELNIFRLAFWLNERGHNCFFICKKGSPIAQRAEKKLKCLYVERTSEYADFRSAWMLKKLCNKSSIEHLVISNGKDIDLSFFAKIFGMKAQTYYQQQMIFNRNKKDIIHTLKYRSLRYWVSPLPFLADMVKEKTKIHKKKVKVIPLCMDLEVFKKEVKRDEVLQDLSLENDRKYLLIVGRIDKDKGQHVAIESLHKIKEDFPDYDLLIVGEVTKNRGPEYLDDLKFKIHDLGLEGRVHFRPFMDDVWKVYAVAEVFMMCSDTETYGMVTIEAMAAGVPVLGSDSGGTKDLVKDKLTGLHFRTMDAEDLSEKLRYILKNNVLRNEMGVKAREVAFENYSHTHECEEFEKLFV